MTISLVAAIAKNRVIGNDNALPWRLPADMKHFRELTMGKPIIMGRKTFESIGRALPGRTNIVISRSQDYKAEGCQIVRSPEKALKAAAGREEVMVIGGAEIYRQFLPVAKRMYLTLIESEFEGDTYFPEYDPGEWQEKERQDFPADTENPYQYSFVVFERK